MNLSMLASITKREKEESRLVLNINTISVFFSSRQTLYDLTELLVGSKSQKVRQYMFWWRRLKKLLDLVLCYKNCT